jgi:hypothetical protein
MPPKYWYKSTKLQCATSHKSLTLVFTTFKTSDLTYGFKLILNLVVVVYTQIFPVNLI